MEAVADASAFSQFVKFARSIGLPIVDMLPPHLRALVDGPGDLSTLPAHIIIDLLQRCAIRSGRSDLGVAFGDWVDLRSLGPVSLLWDHCATIPELLQATKRHLHVESRAMGVEILKEGDEVAYVHLLLIPVKFGGSQFLEATLTSSVRTARLILGQQWSPVRIEFEHSEPGEMRLKQRVFRCPLVHGQSRYAVIFRKTDLDVKLPNKNARMLAHLEAHLESLAEQWPADFTAQVEQLIVANLAGGRARLAHVAGMLAISERTLQRRLGDVGLDFATLLKSVRQRRVDEYFQNETHPNLGQLAYVLGYSDASTASRFLKQEMTGSAKAQRLLAREKDMLAREPQ